MRFNGYLQYAIGTRPTERDEDGEFTPCTVEWSEPIECAITPVTNNSAGRYDDGKFDRCSYKVAVENDELPLLFSRVKLFRGEAALGEFTVQGRPVPTTMYRIIFFV